MHYLDNGATTPLCPQVKEAILTGMEQFGNPSSLHGVGLSAELQFREDAQVIREAMPAAARREKQHPAKRSFQAIRIEVNGELRAVEQAMEGSVDKLLPGGRLAVISFHSLEDRIVKKIFAQQAKGCTCPPEFPVCVCGKKPRLKLISRGVITAGQKELDENPRARSAKLRVAERI